MFDTGNTGFMLVAPSLVMLMTPGLAFFYGGLVGRRNVLSIMIQSFVPPRARQFGLDYETVRDINREIIHLSISGYGPKGPLREKPGLDMMVTAFSGITGMTGEPDGSPVRPGAPATDMSLNASAGT